jgi:hypothetical protein
MAVAKSMGHVDTRMIESRYGHVETNLEYLDRGKTLKDNPFLPLVNGNGNGKVNGKVNGDGKVKGKAGAPPVDCQQRGSHPRPVNGNGKVER